MRETIASKIHLSEARVQVSQVPLFGRQLTCELSPLCQVWFQNRRAKWRKSIRATKGMTSQLPNQYGQSLKWQESDHPTDATRAPGTPIIQNLSTLCNSMFSSNIDHSGQKEPFARPSASRFMPSYPSPMQPMKGLDVSSGVYQCMSPEYFSHCFPFLTSSRVSNSSMVTGNFIPGPFVPLIAKQTVASSNESSSVVNEIESRREEKYEGEK